MTVESLPTFSPPAAKLWKRIPQEARKRLLSNVLCGDCACPVTIANFTGSVKGGDLLLVGQCSKCRGDVARLIESS